MNKNKNVILAVLLSGLPTVAQAATSAEKTSVAQNFSSEQFYLFATKTLWGYYEAIVPLIVSPLYKFAVTALTLYIVIFWAKIAWTQSARAQDFLKFAGTLSVFAVVVTFVSNDKTLLSWTKEGLVFPTRAARV